MQGMHGKTVFLRFTHNPNARMQHYHLTCEAQNWLEVGRLGRLRLGISNENLTSCHLCNTEPQRWRCLCAGGACRVPWTNLRLTSISQCDESPSRWRGRFAEGWLVQFQSPAIESFSSGAARQTKYISASPEQCLNLLACSTTKSMMTYVRGGRLRRDGQVT